MNDATKLSDYPKLHCPFHRVRYPIDRQDWKRVGKGLGLRKPEVYLAVDKVIASSEWALTDKDTFIVEKLDGTNCKVQTADGQIKIYQNRANVIDHTNLCKGQTHLTEGLFNSAAKGYIKPDGEQCGELVGPKVQGNLYDLPHHLFYPFEKTMESLRYNTYQHHEKSFNNLSYYLKNYLKSRFYQKWHGVTPEESPFAEGVIFYNLKRKEEGLSWRLKLRRDMFNWYYEEKGIHIDYSNPLYN